MILISKLNSSDVMYVKNIQLAEEQIKFAGIAEDFLNDKSETMHLYVIKLNQLVVGYFKIDIAYSSQYEFCPEDVIGLRSFVIDKKQQGKGIGTKAVEALLLYVKEAYGNYSAIYLTVNCQNPGAKKCYEKAGFENVDSKYLGGAAGPQYIMYKKY